MKDPVIEKQLPRTELGLQYEFEYCNGHLNSKEHIVRAIKVIEKLEKKGWTKSWIYEAKMLPFKEKYDKSWFDQWSDIISKL